MKPLTGLISSSEYRIVSSAWLRPILERLRTSYYEIITISFFTSLLALSVPIFCLQVYDRVIAHHGMSTFVALSIGVLCALIFDFLLRQARSRLLQHAATQIDAELGRALYQKWCALPLAEIEKKSSHSWQRLFQDMAVLRQLLSGPSAILFADIPFALLFLIVIAIIAPVLAMVLCAVIPLYVLLAIRSVTTEQSKTPALLDKNAARDALLAELMHARVAAKALVIDRAQLPHFEALHADSIAHAYDKGTHSDDLSALGVTLSFLTTVALVVTGALAIISQDITIGGLIATTMLSNRIISPFNQLMGVWKQLTHARECMHRLDAVFSLPSERELGGMLRERPRGMLRVEQVTFHYSPTQQPVLSRIHFDCEPGQMIGLIGRNGSGKSTLIKLLQGLYKPSAGRILLDNADIAQFTRSELARFIGYVPQECTLFSGTIKHNIAMAFPQASDEAIMLASKRAGADTFIIDLPDGYHTQVGESGYLLSGGQRQRIAIARALLNDPPVLLLDEVTSNLDSHAERMLRDQLRALSQDRTIIIATHSVPLLQACHEIIVLDKGGIAMKNTAAQVLGQFSRKQEESV